MAGTYIAGAVLLFVPKDFGLEAEYSNYIQVTELFPLNSNGLETHKDELAISDSKGTY